MATDSSTLVLRLAVNRLPILSRGDKAFILGGARPPASVEELRKRLVLFSTQESLLPAARDRLKALCNPSLLSLALLQAEADEKLLRQRGIDARWLGEGDYPFLLAQIDDPPLVLFVRGELDGEAPLSIAIVGTRSCSPVGRREARRLGAECAELDIPCVSGLASGIDSWAHRGTLSGQGRAIAVLGHGLDTVYPVANRELARAILDRGGAFVSEYAPGTPPWRWNFPARNRIISGLSRAVVVVEAPPVSGSLITADFAADQNRDLWVSRGVLEESAHTTGGTCALLESGARPLDTISQIVEDCTYQCTVSGLPRSEGGRLSPGGLSFEGERRAHEIKSPQET